MVIKLIHFYAKELIKPFNFEMICIIRYYEQSGQLYFSY